MGNSTEARDSPVHVITPQSIRLYLSCAEVWMGLKGRSKLFKITGVDGTRNHPQRGLQLIDIQNST